MHREALKWLRKAEEEPLFPKKRQRLRRAIWLDEPIYRGENDRGTHTVWSR